MTPAFPHDQLRLIALLPNSVFYLRIRTRDVSEVDREFRFESKSRSAVSAL